MRAKRSRAKERKDHEIYQSVTTSATGNLVAELVTTWLGGDRKPVGLGKLGSANRVEEPKCHHFGYISPLRLRVTTSATSYGIRTCRRADTGQSWGIVMTPAEQLEILTRGAAKVISADLLKAKLEEGRPLRVKLGVDPTAPDIHLGHTVALEKLRQFQELGHHVVLIIGDFTAMIGDPSGRSATRPSLTRDQVLANAETYTEQAFKILDKDTTEVVYNGDWFRKMTYDQVLELNSKVTMQQMLQREDFRSRVDNGQEVRLHEIQYPIMQGWDSVEVRSDVEIGGTDQLFNIMVGRDLQKEQGMAQQVAMLVPILEGLDGVKKMSKSLDNYIAVNDAPDDMFGKVMSISDDLMSRYYELLLGENQPDGHPMDAKKQLAKRIVTRYHDGVAGEAALASFEARFSKKDADSADWPEFTPPSERKDLIAIVASAFRDAYGVEPSNGDVRRLIQQGSIQINGEKIVDVKAEPELISGDIIKLDKKRSVRVV